MKAIIEIATTDYGTTRQAVEEGADRIELCAALSEGGTTPSIGMIKICRREFSLPIFPIIRPRSGDFFYSDAEFDIMLEDVIQCRRTGCDGVVTGLLNRDGTIDIKRTTKLIEAAYPLEVTFHRAFDRCRDPFEALEQLVDAGCQRILTSGQQPAAIQGIDLITQLVSKAAGRIVIMPGSGVRKENIRQLAERTGAVEFHTSLRSSTESHMDFKHPAFAGSPESYQNPGIEPGSVKALRSALEGLVKV